MEKKVKNKVIKDVMKGCKNHIKKHNLKSMNEKEFNELFEL